MSTVSLINSLADAMILGDNLSWENASNVGQKISDLAEAITLDELSPEVQQQLLMKLHGVYALYQVCSAKRSNEAEGVDAVAKPTEKKYSPYSDLKITSSVAGGGVLFTNTATGAEEELGRFSIAPLSIAYVIRKLGFDIKELQRVPQESVNTMLTALGQMGATLVKDVYSM